MQNNPVRLARVSHLICAPEHHCRSEPHQRTWTRARRHCSRASHLFIYRQPDCTEYRKTRFFCVPQTCFLCCTYRFRESVVGFGLLICGIIDIKGHIFHGQYLFREMSACKKKKKMKGLVLLQRGLSNTMTKIARVRWNCRVLSCVCCMISVSNAASSHPVVSPHSACCFLLR